jgi:hypothetical protein
MSEPPSDGSGVSTDWTLTAVEKTGKGTQEISVMAERYIFLQWSGTYSSSKEVEPEASTQPPGSRAQARGERKDENRPDAPSIRTNGEYCRFFRAVLRKRGSS